MNKNEQIVKLTYDLSEADRIIGGQAREIRKLNREAVTRDQYIDRLLEMKK